MSIYSRNTFTPCDFMKEYSKELWDKLRTVRSTANTVQQFKYDETTVTQDLIYLFHKLTHRQNIHFYERTDEPVSGADIELRIISNRTNFGFHMYIQSKRVYSPGQTYNALINGHGIQQVDRLINHVQANLPGVLPAYLFYNYHSNAQCNRRPEDFGITIAPAIDLKSRFGITNGGNLTGWTTPPSFELFHITNTDFCIPFYTLFCPGALNPISRRLKFPFSIPFWWFGYPDIFPIIGYYLERGIFGPDWPRLMESFINGNNGIFYAKSFKEELKNQTIQIHDDEEVNQNILKEIRLKEGDKANWLKGFRKVTSKQDSVEDKSNFEDSINPDKEEEIFKSKYKLIFIVD